MTHIFDFFWCEPDSGPQIFLDGGRHFTDAWLFCETLLTGPLARLDIWGPNDFEKSECLGIIEDLRHMKKLTEREDWHASLDEVIEFISKGMSPENSRFVKLKVPGD